MENKMPCRISDLPPTPDDQEEMWKILNDEEWWKPQDEEMEKEMALLEAGFNVKIAEEMEKQNLQQQLDNDMEEDDGRN